LESTFAEPPNEELDRNYDGDKQNQPAQPGMDRQQNIHDSLLNE
jgi:hypothetical protein